MTSGEVGPVTLAASNPLHQIFSILGRRGGRRRRHRRRWRFVDPRDHVHAGEYETQDIDVLDRCLVVDGGLRPKVCDHRLEVVVTEIAEVLRRHHEQPRPVLVHAFTNCAKNFGVGPVLERTSGREIDR